MSIFIQVQEQKKKHVILDQSGVRKAKSFRITANKKKTVRFTSFFFLKKELMDILTSSSAYVQGKNFFG